MNVRGAALAGALLVSFVAAGERGAAQSPAPSNTYSPLKSAPRTLAVDGVTRNYNVYRPASIPASAHPALVVVVHGYSGSARQVESNYNWDDEAESGGFVVVFPNGTETSWNSGNCCATALLQKVDDVKFLTLLVQQLEAEERVDPRRIFFSGMSNGALMSYRMACDAKFPIAGIAPVSGSLDFACPSPQKTSLISINGRSDRMIPYDGGKKADPSTVSADVQAWRVNLPAIEDVMAKWRALDGCGPLALRRDPPLTTEIATCPGGRAVEEIAIDGAGHQWPGGKPPDAAAQGRIAALAARGIYVDRPSTALDATHVIWQFFSTKVSL